MAEGDKKNDSKHRENPFSLSNFLNVNNQRDRQRVREGDERLSQAVSSNAATHADDSNTNSDAVPATPEENPFSFRRFLDGAPVASSSNAHSQMDQHHRFMVTSDLPDFVQDHFGSSAAAAAAVGSSSTDNDLLLPLPSVNSNDNTLDDGLPDFDLHMSAAAPPEPGFLEMAPSFSPSSSTTPPLANSTSSGSKLPDFLSDSLPAPSAGEEGLASTSSGSGENSNSSAAVTGSPVSRVHLEETVSELRAENTRLQERLQSAETQLTNKTVTATRLRAQLTAQEQREREETAAMELMLKRVEKNLLESQERAAAAENEVTRLTAELQAARSAAAAACAAGGPGAAAAATGRDLLKAAEQAETSIKQLRDGVRWVKTLAEHLSELDRFTEVENKEKKKEDS